MKIQKIFNVYSQGGRKQMTKYIVMALLLISLFLVSCTPAEKVCSVDKDCMPAQCCHAYDAVNKDNAPDCAGVFCTMDCQPDTLDCGQGEIKCTSGKCKVIMK